MAGLGIKAATGFNGQNFHFKSKFQARMWNHFCVSWQLYKNTGEVQVFLNGDNIGQETFISDSVVNGIAGSDEVFESFFILGQEPDVIGPPYEKEDLFQGIITEVNFWDKVLDQNTISKLATCKQFLKGNIISWSKDQFDITKARVKGLSDKKSLCASEKKLVIFPEPREIEDSRVLCTAHGGKLFTPKNKEENDNIVQLVMTKKDQCIGSSTDDNPSISWIGVRSQNFVYYDTNDEAFLEPISYSNFVREPFQSDRECAILKLDGTWDSSSECSFKQFCTVCEFLNTPSILLRGVCMKAVINWVYYLRVDDENGDIFYDGYKSSRIKVSERAWIFSERPGFDRKQSNMSLPFSPPRQYPIGSH